MKKTAVLLMAFLLISACGKKGSVSEKPERSAETQPPTVGSLPPEDNSPFVIPPSAKKQAKYYPEGTPTRAIQDLDDLLDSYNVNPKTPEEKQYNERLKRMVIHGTFDVRELCRLALDKHWSERTPQEQDYFVDLMTRLLEKKAIFSKEQGEKKKKTKVVYQVNYAGHKFLNTDQSNALAMSSVSIPSQSMKIDLNYKLKKMGKPSVGPGVASGGGGWNIYDVIVDGASLLDNYKYQFDKIIAKEGYPNLIHRMESKLKDLQSKDAEEPVSPANQ